MQDQAKPDRALPVRIRERRKALGLTQRQVADAMNVKSTESVRKWESGEQAPDLVRLGPVLGVRPAWLATGEAPMLLPVAVDREQLDRIEALLIGIQGRLGQIAPAVDPAEEIERELKDAAEPSEQPTDDSGRDGRARGREGR